MTINEKLYFNGDILTLEDELYVEAILIKGDKIHKIGKKEELLKKPYIEKLLQEGGFERFVFLGKKDGKCIIKNKLTVGEMYD